ncbi:hypothetical protein EPO33_04905 [Patescibacteria group bacterium]|nr:MAG: hypothetical protein EPO33_04905 [Patescibacteria group bacterium]
MAARSWSTRTMTLVGAGTAILASLITAAATLTTGRGSPTPVAAAESPTRDVTGRWEGVSDEVIVNAGHAALGSPARHFQVTLTLVPTAGGLGGIIEAVTIVDGGAGSNYHEVIEDMHFEHDDFVRLAFASDDPRTHDFGAGLLQISPMGDAMTGYLVANRIDESGIMILYVELRRTG